MGDSTKTIALIGCSKRKRPNKCRASDLYSASPYFRKELEYARRVICADKVYILSAKHHLISEEKIIEPYNETLIGKPAKDRQAWAECTFRQIQKTFSKEDKLVLLCGAKYYEFLEKMLKKGGYNNYCIPLQGKGGIGKQLQWLAGQINDCSR